MISIADSLYSLILLRWHLINSCIPGIATETFVQISKCWQRNMQNFKSIQQLIRRAKYE